MKYGTFVVAALFALCSFAILTAQDKKEEKKPETIKVKMKDVRIFKTIKGVVESTEVVEIKTDFEQWTDLTIERLADEGTQVSEGSTLLAFETEDIDKSLADTEFSLAGAKLDVEDANLAMDELRKTEELNRKIAENKWSQAQEDHDYYFKIERVEEIDGLEFQEQSSNWSVEYAAEELDQLRKMYTEDELTEESELIVLKRAERDLVYAKRSKRRSELSVQRRRKLSIPRSDKERENGLTLARLEFEKYGITSQVKKARTEIALKRSEFDVQQKEKNYERLLADRKKMELTSPVSGILYHGKCQRGKWVGASGSTNRRLEIGRKIPVNKVVMTIVNPDKVAIRVDLDEADLGLVKAGMNGFARLTADKNANVPVTIGSVGMIPLDNGKYDCQVNLTTPKRMMPGMNCEVVLLVHESDNQLVLPSKSVFTDDGINHYVFLANGTRAQIEVGMESGDDIEITGNLALGTEILASKPE